MERITFVSRFTFRVLRVSSIVWLGLLSAVQAASACPGCKEALFDPGHLAERLATAKGYALSIGVLLTVPFALVGGVTALVVRAARRSKRLS